WGMIENKALSHATLVTDAKRHLIQYCPTNGDPNCNVKGLKLPTRIPKSISERSLVPNARVAFSVEGPVHELISSLLNEVIMLNAKETS
ncbi:hypothetical protein GIB67_024101, partial [Kingdonia uniflora]